MKSQKVAMQEVLQQVVIPKPTIQENQMQIPTRVYMSIPTHHPHPQKEDNWDKVSNGQGLVSCTPQTRTQATPDTDSRYPRKLHSAGSADSGVP
jgi:hypothetical protein